MRDRTLMRNYFGCGRSGNSAGRRGTCAHIDHARTAVTSRQRVGVPAGPSDEAPEHTESVGAAPSKPASKGRQRFNRWLVRFGVPGASILGPLAIPTQFTTAALVAAGTPRGWVLLWQAVAIVIWTTVATVSALIALQVVSLI